MPINERANEAACEEFMRYYHNRHRDWFFADHSICIFVCNVDYRFNGNDHFIRTVAQVPVRGFDQYHITLHDNDWLSAEKHYVKFLPRFQRFAWSQMRKTLS